MFRSRVTVLVGHFGSGKTEIAIHGAQTLADGGLRTVLVDLDVVKPYFRSRSARDILAAKGIEVVAPTGENVFGDLPIIVPRIRTVLRDPSTRVIVDAGGDPTGARALGSVLDALPADDTSVVAVLNFRRPFTETVDAAVAMVREIEATARVRVDAVVANTHLLDETTPEVVRDGYGKAVEVAERLGVPVAAVALPRAVLPRCDGDGFPCEVIPLDRVVKPPFEQSRRERTSGPLFVVT